MPRAVAAILVALVAALVFPGSVMAAKAQRFSDSATSLFCPALQADAGTVSVSGWIGERGGTYLEFAFWPDQVEPWESQPGWVGYSTATLLDGPSVEVTFDVYAAGDPDSDESSDPTTVGQATLTATFQPTGETETFDDHLRDGNRQYRASGSWERLAVSGTLELPEGMAFDVSDCDASNFTESTFLNAPTATTGHQKSLMVMCTWTTETGYITFSAEESPSLGTGAWLWIEGADGYFYSDGTASLSTSALEASLDVISLGETETLAGTATAAATLTSGDRFKATNTFGDSRYSAKGVWLIPEGTLTLELPFGTTTTLAIDEEHCTGLNVHVSQVPARQERAEPVGNDTPDAAIPLKLFDSVTVSTAGTVEAPEAPCLFEDGDGGTFEGPITNTVWWRIEGTGASLSVDTAGSSFDTMVAVYLAEGDDVGAQVGCVDDVDESLQSRITFDTAVDASYVIQTGGFDGQTGDLTVTVSE